MRTKSTIRNLNLYLHVLMFIRDHNRLPVIKKRGKVKNIQWYVDRLKRLNLINKISYGTWDLTDKGRGVLDHETELKVKKSMWDKLILLKQPVRLDFSARLLVPIVKMLDMFPYDVINQAGMYMSERMPHYDVGLTFRLTPKQNLEIYIHHKDLDSPADLEILIRKVLHWTKEYFASRRVLVLDITHAKTNYIKFGLHDPLTKKAIPKGVDETIRLGRPREKILKPDKPTEATVAYDATPEDMTIHTNDRAYVRKYLMMPETLDTLAIHFETKFTPAIQDLTTQIKTHLAVQQKQLENQDKMNILLDQMIRPGSSKSEEESLILSSTRKQASVDVSSDGEKPRTIKVKYMGKDVGTFIHDTKTYVSERNSIFDYHGTGLMGHCISVGILEKIKRLGAKVIKIVLNVSPGITNVWIADFSSWYKSHYTHMLQLDKQLFLPRDDFKQIAE